MTMLLLSFVPAFIFLVLLVSYGFVFGKRREKFLKLLMNDNIIQYLTTHDARIDVKSTTKEKQSYSSLIGFSRGSIFFAGLLTTLVIWIITVLCITKFNIGIVSTTESSIFDELRLTAATWANPNSPTDGISIASFFAAFGAYLWGVYECLVRFRRRDWTPVLQHQIWLRIPIAMLLTYFIQDAFKDAFTNLVAFSIGAFPLDILRKFLHKYTSSKIIDLQGNEVKIEEPHWEKLQGISAGVIERLTEVDIENTTQLAYCNPLELHIKTNIEWKVLLDLMDQAILLSYCGDKFQNLRPLGVRGAVELSIHFYRYYDTDPKYGPLPRSPIPNNISNIAAALETSEDNIKNLMHNIYEDSQVNLIWEIWNQKSDASS